MYEASRFLGGFTIFGWVGLNAYNTPIYSSHRSQHAMHIHLSYTRHSFLRQTAINILMTWSLFSTYNTIYIFLRVHIYKLCSYIFEKTEELPLIPHKPLSMPPTSFLFLASHCDKSVFFFNSFFFLIRMRFAKSGLKYSKKHLDIVYGR